MRMRGWIAQFYARGVPKVSLAIEGEGKGDDAAASKSSVRQRPQHASALAAGVAGAW